MYAQAMQMAFCQPTVLGLLLFHVQDEAALAAWQSGEYYVDGTPKTSLAGVRRRRRRACTAGSSPRAPACTDAEAGGPRGDAGQDGA